MSQTLILHLFIGSVLLALAMLMKFWPPKKINSFYGYRTPRSMKNQMAWDEGNSYCADLMIWAGISTIVVQFLCYLFVRGEISILIPVGYYLVFVLASIVLTERRLKTKGF